MKSSNCECLKRQREDAECAKFTCSHEYELYKFIFRFNKTILVGIACTMYMIYVCLYVTPNTLYESCNEQWMTTRTRVYNEWNKEALARERVRERARGRRIGGTKPEDSSSEQ